MSDELTSATGPSLEAAIERLEEIARDLESGELELDRSLALYEEGIRLVRVCESHLTAAQGKVEKLRAHGEGFRFDPVPERG